MSAAMTAADGTREAAFADWWSGTAEALPAGSEDVAHEAFCAGWETSAPHIAAAERERIYDQLGHDHYVVFTEDRWTVEHSVECRLSGRMHECGHHAAVARITAEFDPDMAGRWRIASIDSDGLPDLVRADPSGGTR